MYIYNCHTHLFNLDCTPKRFLGGMVGSWFGRLGARLLQGLLAVPAGKTATLWLANKFPFARKYAAFLRIGTSLSPLAIFEQELLPAYPEGTRFVVLPINFDLMGAGAAPLNQESQLWQLLEVRKRYPNTCLPFVSLDPRQGSAQENKNFVEKWIGRGFVGIKLYPGLGFYPFDARLYEVYEYAEAHGLPIMTHCSRGGIYYQGPITAALVNPQPPIPLPAAGNQPGPPYNLSFIVKPSTNGKPVPNDAFCDSFLDPYAYKPVLDRYPKLKLCLAHYGGGEEIQAFNERDKLKKEYQTKRKQADADEKAMVDAKKKVAAAQAVIATKAERGKKLSAAQKELQRATAKAEKSWKAAAALDATATWYSKVREMIKIYPSLYTDVSYTLADTKLFPTLAADVLSQVGAPPPDYLERVLFGTDFFMTSQEKEETLLAAELMTDLINRAKGPLAWEQLANTNPKKYLQSDFYTPA